MRLIKTLLFIPLFVLFFAFQKQQGKEWQKNSKLVWSDFKAKAPENSFHAITQYSISFDMPTYNEETKSYEYKIKCFFNPQKSWSVKSKQSNYLLQHEQIHFDLAKLYSIKMEQALNKAKIGYEEGEIKSKEIFKKYMNDLSEIQRKYDVETDHSKIKDKQLEWNRKIEIELINLLK